MQNNFFSKSIIVDVLEKPNKNSNVSSQIIYGEKFKILSKNQNFYKVKNLYDNYIGFINKKVKINKQFKPTHKIKTLKAQIYFGNVKRKKKLSNKYLPFGSKLQVISKNNSYVMFEKNKWLKFNDICFISNKDKNFIKIFKLFVNCPYKWGAKTFEGIDCSALVQIFFNHNNKYCPRDSKDQEKYFKKKVKFKNIKKNDMIFWKGHVAVALSKNKLIHAYGPMKKVVIMNTKKTIERIYKTANLKITSIKRA